MGYSARGQVFSAGERFFCDKEDISARKKLFFAKKGFFCGNELVSVGKAILPAFQVEIRQ